MNKRRHSDVKFCSFDEAKHLVNSPLFRSIEEYGKCFSSIQDKDLSTPAQSGFAPILVLYTTMMMKQYHLKHFYVN